MSSAFRIFTPLRVGWPPTPQVFFWSVTGAKYFTYITVGSLNTCACYLHLYFKRATIPFFWDPPNGCFYYLFPRVRASQAREFQIATTTTPRKLSKRHSAPLSAFFSTKSSKSRVFWSVFACFCHVFLQNTVIYIFVAIKPFQNIIFFYNVSNSLVSPNPWKHRYIHCFLQFFHVPMPLVNLNI